jgi:hypothetical protein
MMPSRPSVFICSVIVHVIVIGALPVVSAVAPGLLPTPASSLVYAIAAPRQVRLVDVPLPRTTRPRSQPSNADSSAPVVRTAAAPVVSPDTLPDNTAAISRRRLVTVRPASPSNRREPA